MKTLVIDDDFSVRAAVSYALESANYVVIEAAGGQEGLELARTELPDLVLSDISMSGMDGFEVLRQLRADPATSAIPVILMTGVPERADSRSGMEQGADDFLAKPFEMQELLASVRARLERQAKAKANESRLLELLSATRDLIAILDPQTGRMLYLNDAGREMLAIGAAEISNFSFAEFLQAGSSATFKDWLAVVQLRGLWTGESTLRARDGRRIPVSAQILAHKGAELKSPFLSVVARDISERKCTETALEKANEELMKASRRAGMAEVATGVLHNIGNVLTSIHVATTRLAEGSRNSKVANLSKVVELLLEHGQDLSGFFAKDPRGPQLPGYLAQLSERLMAEQQAAIEELGQLQKHVEHMREIVRAQQNYARSSAKVESIKVSDLIEEALQMNAASLFHHDIRVVKEYRSEATLRLEKHKALQILVNLINNARQACQASSEREKKLVVRAMDGGERVTVEVSDNGIGIAPEHLSRVFLYGFTTKENGHGFGLHSSAVLAREMGGTLLVHSEGPGNGATFTLKLPLTAPA